MGAGVLPLIALNGSTGDNGIVETDGVAGEKGDTGGMDMVLLFEGGEDKDDTGVLAIGGGAMSELILLS